MDEQPVFKLKFGQEMHTYINNIKYYCDKFNECIQKQIDEDGKNIPSLDIEANRFINYACMASGAETAKTYMQGVETNLNQIEHPFVKKEEGGEKNE